MRSWDLLQLFQSSAVLQRSGQRNDASADNLVLVQAVASIRITRQREGNVPFTHPASVVPEPPQHRRSDQAYLRHLRYGQYLKAAAASAPAASFVTALF